MVNPLKFTQLEAVCTLVTAHENVHTGTVQLRCGCLCMPVVK